MTGGAESDLGDPSGPAEWVVAAHRALAAGGQSDMVWGHASVRDPDGRGFWVKAAGWGFEEVTPERVQLVSFDGGLLEGSGSVHVEWPIHAEVLRGRPDVACVVHTHAPPVVAFGALGVPLLPLSHDGALLGGRDVPRFEATGGLVRTPALGAALARKLDDAKAVLLPTHGLVTAGADVPAAVMYAVLVSRACEVQRHAMAAGPLRVWSDAAEAAGKADECWPPRQLAAGWGYLLRRASHGRSVDGSGTGP